MLWQDEEPQTEKIIPHTVVDVVFDMNCRCLPIDHAYALSQAIQRALPWFAEEPQAGLHLIHGAESSHGWQRPNAPDSLLYLSRRTKLTLRLPLSRFAEAQALSGMTLEIAGYTLQVGKASAKPLTKMPVLFARYVVASPEQEEEVFLHQAIAQFQQMGISCHKALCGKTALLNLPNGKLFTRSLMAADLSPSDSLTLQQQGLGTGRNLGCGLFLPHKGVKAVKQAEAE
jgi:CRISPR-associated protein Cas6